jgi:outer membrane protein assembly factor BamE (lipoprotein component of BamABCDE complex)
MLDFPKAALAALLLVGSSSCFLSRVDIQQPISSEVVTALEPGVHTAADVVERLGAPSEVVQLGHRSAYRYEYQRNKTTGMFLFVVGLRGVDQRSDRVWVFFDKEDRLTHVAATFEADNTEFELPFLGEDD